MALLDDWNVLGCQRSDCRQSTDSFPFNDPNPHTCETCGRLVAVHLYPALTREYHNSESAAADVVASESSCFYHPNKSASVVCDGCGRFLCSLCDIAMNERHYCSTCIEHQSADESNTETVRRFVHRDSLAFGLSILGTFFWFVSFVTAPIVLYLVVRYWRSTQSLLTRNRWRFVVAGIIATLQLSLWGLFFLGLMA